MHVAVKYGGCISESFQKPSCKMELLTKMLLRLTFYIVSRQTKIILSDKTHGLLKNDLNFHTIAPPYAYVDKAKNVTYRARERHIPKK